MKESDFRVSADILRLNPSLSLNKQTVPNELSGNTGILKASKYKNVKTEVKGMTFQSKHEAAGVTTLIFAEEHHLIFGLRLQVRFPLAKGITYVADAVYLDDKIEPHVVDFKGYATPVFKLKQKLFEQKYGHKIELR